MDTQFSGKQHQKFLGEVHSSRKVMLKKSWQFYTIAIPQHIQLKQYTSSICIYAPQEDLVRFLHLALEGHCTPSHKDGFHTSSQVWGFNISKMWACMTSWGEEMVYHPGFRAWFITSLSKERVITWQLGEGHHITSYIQERVSCIPKFGHPRAQKQI